MFYLEKETGWKERGAGMLKINVPEACVEIDEVGVPKPGSFDVSGLEEDEGDGGGDARKTFRGVRLLMRQDQTHRVILNTVVLPAMAFQEKATLTAVSVMFTSFEGDDARPVSVLMRVCMPPP